VSAPQLLSTVAIDILVYLNICAKKRVHLPSARLGRPRAVWGRVRRSTCSLRLVGMFQSTGQPLNSLFAAPGDPRDARDELRRQADCGRANHGIGREKSILRLSLSLSRPRCTSCSLAVCWPRPERREGLRSREERAEWFPDPLEHPYQPYGARGTLYAPPDRLGAAQSRARQMFFFISTDV